MISRTRWLWLICLFPSLLVDGDIYLNCKGEEDPGGQPVRYWIKHIGDFQKSPHYQRPDRDGVTHNQRVEFCDVATELIDWELTKFLRNKTYNVILPHYHLGNQRQPEVYDHSVLNYLQKNIDKHKDLLPVIEDYAVKRSYDQQRRELIRIMLKGGVKESDLLKHPQLRPLLKRPSHPPQTLRSPPPGAIVLYGNSPNHRAWALKKTKAERINWLVSMLASNHFCGPAAQKLAAMGPEATTALPKLKELLTKEKGALRRLHLLVAISKIDPENQAIATQINDIDTSKLSIDQFQAYLFSRDYRELEVMFEKTPDETQRSQIIQAMNDLAPEKTDEIKRISSLDLAKVDDKLRFAFLSKEPSLHKFKLLVRLLARKGGDLALSTKYYKLLDKIIEELALKPDAVMPIISDAVSTTQNNLLRSWGIKYIIAHRKPGSGELKTLLANDTTKWDTLFHHLQELKDDELKPLKPAIYRLFKEQKTHYQGEKVLTVIGRVEKPDDTLQYLFDQNLVGDSRFVAALSLMERCKTLPAPATDLCLKNYSVERPPTQGSVDFRIMALAAKHRELGERLMPIMVARARKLHAKSASASDIGRIAINYLEISRDLDRTLALFAPMLPLDRAGVFFDSDWLIKNGDKIAEIEKKLTKAYTNDYTDRKTLTKYINTCHLALLQKKLKISDVNRTALLERFAKEYSPINVSKFLKVPSIHEDNAHCMGEILRTTQDAKIRKGAMNWCLCNKGLLRKMSIEAQQHYFDYWVNAFRTAGNDTDKAYAVQNLQGIIHPKLRDRTYQFLAAALLDPDSKVAAAAFNVLETMGTSILPQLMKEIKDGDPFMAMNACFLISGMSVKARSVVPALEKELKKKNWQMKVFIIQALKGVGGVSPETVEYIKKLGNTDKKKLAQEVRGIANLLGTEADDQRK